MSVPRIIWQTYKTKSVPLAAKGCVRSWNIMNPDWRHVLTNDIDITAFFRDNCSAEEYAVFRGLPLGVMKADFWRYAVLYKHGGVYVPTPTASLLERVKEFGPIEPVIVRPMANNKFEILANAEIWVATGRAGLHEVPVLIRDDLDDDLAREIVRSHYGPITHNAIDEAKRFEDQLEALGGRKRRGAVGKLAVAIGRSRPYLAHSLRLLTLPADIQELIERGTLSAGQARPLVSIRNRASQMQPAKAIVANKLTARAAEALANRIKNGVTTIKSKKTIAGTEKSPDTKRFERQVSEIIGTRFSLENGRAIIDYDGNLEVLQGIVERLGYRGA